MVITQRIYSFKLPINLPRRIGRPLFLGYFEIRIFFNRPQEEEVPTSQDNRYTSQRCFDELLKILGILYCFYKKIHMILY